VLFNFVTSLSLFLVFAVFSVYWPLWWFGLLVTRYIERGWVMV